MKKSPDKVLIVDCQVFQTPAWHRGMGKYSLNFIEAISRIDEDEMGSIIFTFNKNLPIEAECKQKLAEIIPETRWVFLDLAVLKNKKIVNFQESNKKILTSYVDTNFAGNCHVSYLILSLFLGEATCVVFPNNVRKILLFYDLIPFLYAERYQKRIPYDDYLANFKTVFEADLFLSISQTVADDLSIYLGIPDEKIVNINGAAINRSHLTPEKPSIEVGDHFILMPSGDEIRKNNTRAVKGFDIFNQSQGGKYKLILTSFFSEPTIEELKSYSDNLIFTGNIKESELHWLYQKADLILFASEYEGLGLPVLEAMTINNKIACSDIPVFKEISKNAFYYFNHLKPSEIGKGITNAIHDHSFSEKLTLYGSILDKYTWQNSADAFLRAYSRSDSLIPAQPKPKPKIAIFTPHPSGFSAIGKVVAESHSSLSELFDVDYYFDFGLYHKEVRPDYLSSVANCYSATEFNARKYADYQAVIYHIGNSDYHLESIKNALYLPGYIILHDTYLDGAYERLAIDGYMSDRRIYAEKLLNKFVKPQSSRYLTSLLNAQLGVLCHSKYAANAAKKVLESDITVGTLNLPVATPIIINEKANGERLNICFAGIFADVKGLEIIEDLAHTLGDEGVEISIFGFDFAQPDSLARIKQLDNVKIIANPSDFEFQTLLSKQDIIVNYRLTYRGETSLTTLEAMRYGVVPIVRNIGWYKELPENAVVRIDTKEDVVPRVLELFNERQKLKLMSTKSVEFIKQEYGHHNYCNKILSYINSPQNDKLNLQVKKDILNGASLSKIITLIT